MTEICISGIFYNRQENILHSEVFQEIIAVAESIHRRSRQKLRYLRFHESHAGNERHAARHPEHH
jgi:hypothetical protein